MIRTLCASLVLAALAAAPAQAGERVATSRVVPCADTSVGRAVCGGKVTSSGPAPSAEIPAEGDVRLGPEFFQGAASGGVGEDPTAYVGRGRVVVVVGAGARATASASARVRASGGAAGCGCR